jgi:hypothetical protein
VVVVGCGKGLLINSFRAVRYLAASYGLFGGA